MPVTPASRVVTWARAHVALVAGAFGALVIGLVGGVAIVVSSSSGGAPSVAPGSIVQASPLTSGYRVTGSLVVRGADTLSVKISRVDASAGEARNVVLRPGATIEFDRPAEGTVALARNGHQIDGPQRLRPGDTVTLVGQFTSVVVHPAPPHEGYSFFGVEADGK